MNQAKLLKVHPDLVKVVTTALQTPQPFDVVYGIRTVAEEKVAVATHHSTTMHSRHLANKQGLACAVDVAALINGKISFAPGQEEKIFTQIWNQIHAAGVVLNIPLEWGGNWPRFKDWGHVQLPWSQYP